MKPSLQSSLVVLLLLLSSACTRIETGEVGVRIGFDRQVTQGELMPGTFNQTIIGDVLTFQVKDVAVKVDDVTPIAKDNSTMKDFDATIIYSVNPTQVAEIYISKNRSFHTTQNHDVLLMYNYVYNAARNAIYKSARRFDALEMNDGRPQMELEIKELIAKSFAEEKLEGSLTVSQVLIRNIAPADAVVASANDLVRSKNEFRQKEVEVQTARKEAERMAALSNQSVKSISYMQAQALLNISEGIKMGKVNTVVIPADFRGLLNLNAK